MEISIKLTVYFEEMFWVGVFEKFCKEKYEVSRIVFGSEPKDYEVYDFILKNFNKLKFGTCLLNDEDKKIIKKQINPKRLNREIKKETQSVGIGTKAQLAMKLQYEENKTERKKFSKEQKEMEKERKFQLRQKKKLMKHKGH